MFHLGIKIKVSPFFALLKGKRLKWNMHLLVRASILGFPPIIGIKMAENKSIKIASEENERPYCSSCKSKNCFFMPQTFLFLLLHPFVS